MKQIQFNADKYKNNTSKHKERWQSIAEDMSTFFNTNCYYIFHKHKLFVIEDAFRECKERDIHNIRYFWAIINNRESKI